MGFGPLPGGLKPWNSSQTLFDGSNLYYSDGTTFVNSSGNVTLLGGTIDGMVIGGATPANGFFSEVFSPLFNNGSGNTTLRTQGGGNTILQAGGNTLVLVNDSAGGALLLPGGIIQVNNVTAPSTPIGGFVLYSSSGQPHTLDVNGVNINLSLCPQPSAIYALPLDVGDPTQVIASTASLATIQTSMNLVTAGSGDALFAVCQLMKAIQSGFNAGPAQYPVSS